MRRHLPAQDKAAAWSRRLLEDINHDLEGGDGVVMGDLPLLGRPIATVNQTLADMVAVFDLQLHQT